jgi:hypothetical protein
MSRLPPECHDSDRSGQLVVTDAFLRQDPDEEEDEEDEEDEGEGNEDDEDSADDDGGYSE